ncbi:hypothetical protein [Cupriavidus pinatubonensis]|uniref:hypothetical protein n=1 Tax=Cupriavidus pinatubonensis TaxID=248026 RepID=UPI0036085C1C
MKDVTVALLTLIEWRSGLSPAQLEDKFGLGLQRDLDDDATGQEWNRYRSRPGTCSKSEQALSRAKAVEVAELALALGYASEADLTDFNLLNLGDTKAIAARLDNERTALKLFRSGVKNLSQGKLALPPGGSKGGRPRPPRSRDEAVKGYEAWTTEIGRLGCEVVEDRAEVAESDHLLWEQAMREDRLVTVDDYDCLPEWVRPLDPARPIGGALNRLRIRLAFGQLDQPWLPKDRRIGLLTPVCPEVLPSTVGEIDQFFENLQKDLNRSILNLPQGNPCPCTPLP